MKSILVELDEQTSNLMKSVNSDLTSEISERVDSSIKKTVASLQRCIEDEVGSLSSTTANTLSGIKSELKNLADSLDELSDDLNGLDQIAGLKSVVIPIKEAASTLATFATTIENQGKESNDVSSAIIKEIGTMYSLLNERLQQSDDIISLKISEAGSSSQNEIHKCQQISTEQAEKLLNGLSEIKKENSESSQRMSEYIAKKIDTIKNIAISIEDIAGKIKETEKSHHKKITEDLLDLKAKFGSIFSSLNERLQERDDLISSNILDVKSSSQKEILKCQQISIEQAEKLLTILSEIKKENSENLKQSGENISNKIESVKKNIAISIEDITSNIKETQTNLDVAERNVLSRIDNLEKSFNAKVENLDREISALNTVIDQQSKIFLSELAEIRVQITQAMRQQDFNASQAEKNHAAITNLLDKIVYLTTPFWKRKKNTNGEKD